VKQEGEKPDSVYEIYVQKMIPKEIETVPYRFKTERYLSRKANIQQLKRGKVIADVEAEDSSSEEESEVKYAGMKAFYDKD
jgi:hypothetical protein